MPKKYIFAYSDETHRGVGLLPRYVRQLQPEADILIETVHLDEIPETDLSDCALLVFIMGPPSALSRIFASIVAHHKRKNQKADKVILWMPDRNRPKTVIDFMESLIEKAPDSFDGMAHIAEYNRDYWKNQPVTSSKLHVLIENPYQVSENATTKKTAGEKSLIASGAFTKFKGLGNLIDSSELTYKYPDTLFAYTGCQYQRTKNESKKLTGSPELVSCLVDSLSTKNQHESLELHDEDIWSKRLKKKLNIFPSYSDREENKRRIAASGVFIFTPLSVKPGENRKWILERQLKRWSSTVDYNILEAMETGTVCLISKRYHSSVLKKLEDSIPEMPSGPIE